MIYVIRLFILCSQCMNFLVKEHLRSEQRLPVEISEEIHHTHDAMRMCQEAIYKKANSVISLKYGSCQRRNPSKQRVHPFD